MGVDAARPMTIGGTHPPSLGVGVVGPTHVAYSSSVPTGSGVDVALRTSGPTLADARPDIPRPRPAHASQYAAVCTGVQVQTPVETLTAQSLLLLGRRTASPPTSQVPAVVSSGQTAGIAATEDAPATQTSPAQASLTVLDFACAPSPSLVVAPRPTAASVHRPLSAVGVRPPKSPVLLTHLRPWW